MSQKPSFRTPLGRVRWLGAAHAGVEDASRMHLTSIALVPLSIAFVWLVLSLLAKDYNGARAELGEPIPALVMLTFVLAGVYHMQLGMRSVIVDYIHGRGREWALILNTLVCIALGLACVYAILRIGFV